MNLSSFSRRPLLAVALSVLSGTWLSLQLPPINLFLRTGVWALLFMSCPVAIRKREFCLLLLFLLSFLNTEYRSIQKDPQTLSHFLKQNREHIEIQAELVTLPQRRLYGDGQLGPFEAVMEVNRLKDGRGWRKVRGRIQLRTSSGALEHVRIGDQFQLRGSFDRGGDRVLPYPLLGVLWFEKDAFHPVRKAGPMHFGAWCSAQRERCARLLEAGLIDHPDAAKILQAVLLGYREGIPSQWVQHFAATGTLHVFAISGLHVGLVGLILIAALRLAGLGPHQWVWPLLPLLVFYTLLTGAQPSAVRACVMALTFWSALALQRKPDAPSALALAAILMLAAFPGQLQSVGFIFSFLVVGGLLLFCAPVYEFLTRDSEPQFLPLRMNAWHRVRILLRNRLLMVVAVSGAAWIASAPLTAYVFNRVTPVALVGNLVVAPAAFVMISLGLGALAAGSLHPILAVPLNRLNAVGIDLLLGFIETLSTLPYSNAYVKSPSLIWVLGAYTVMILPRFLSRRFKIPLVACGVLLLFLTAMLRLFSSPSLQVFPTTRGLCLLLNGRGSAHMLMDTGSRMDSWTVIRRLRSEGVDRLRALVLTHPDAHHYGGMAELSKALPIEKLLVGPMKGSQTYQSRVMEFRALEIPVETLFKGWTRIFPGDVKVDVLYPKSASNMVRADDGALVVRFSRGLSSVLVLGDASPKAQQAILGQGVHPGAETLVITGSGEELDPAFLAWCRPDRVILTGPMPAPSVWRDLLSRAGRRSSPVLRTVFRSREPITIEL